MLEIEKINIEAGLGLEISVISYLRNSTWGYINEFLYDDICKRLNYITKEENRIEEFLKDLGIKRIAIYGGGRLGERLIHILEGTDIRVACVLDRNPSGQLLGYEKISLDQINDMDCDAVIVTPLQYGNMASKMKERDIKKVIVLYDLALMLSSDMPEEL